MGDVEKIGRAMGIFDTLIKAGELFDRRRVRAEELEARRMERASHFMESLADALKGMAEEFRAGRDPVDRCAELDEQIRFLEQQVVSAEDGDRAHYMEILNSGKGSDLALDLLMRLSYSGVGPYALRNLLADARARREAIYYPEVRDHMISVILATSGWCRAIGQQLLVASEPETGP